MTEFDESKLVPKFYTVSAKITDEQLAQVINAIRITPVATVIILTAHDGELANNFGCSVLHVSTLPNAFKLARESNEPSIIVTGDVPLAASYADRIEVIIP